MGPRGSGDLYGTGQQLPATPAEAVELARSDKQITTLLGEDAVHDYTLLVERDWHAYITTVTDWERDPLPRSGLMTSTPFRIRWRSWHQQPWGTYD